MSAWVVRRARRLVEDSRDHPRSVLVADLGELARNDPNAVALLAVELAHQLGEREDEARHDDAASGVLERRLSDELPHEHDVVTVVTREAHRLHYHGVRGVPWVDWGERLYQKLKKQAHRRRVPA